MKRNVVLQAIEATRKNPEGQAWLEGIYRKVSSEGGTGSYLPMSPEEVRKVVENADWEVEVIREGNRRSVIAVMRGVLGVYNMIRLADLDDDRKLVVANFHGDKPQLGLVSGDYAGTPTDELRAVCGTDQDGNGTFLITVFPGPNINPEAIEVPEKYLGQTITVGEAKLLGASHCKVVKS